jgi:hypothetical protein
LQLVILELISVLHFPSRFLYFSDCITAEEQEAKLKFSLFSENLLLRVWEVKKCLIPKRQRT